MLGASDHIQACALRRRLCAPPEQLLNPCLARFPGCSTELALFMGARRGRERGHHQSPIVAQHGDVASRTETFHGSGARWILPGNCAHTEIVRQDDAFEIQFLPKQIIYDAPRKRRRPSGINPRQQNMRGHYGGNARFDDFGKRNQFHFAEPLERALENRQFEMRIGFGVAVTGEMFRAAKNSFGREAARKCRAEFSDTLGIGAEAAIRRNRATRTKMQIEHWREYKIAAHGQQLARDRPCHGFNRFGIIQFAEFSGGRPLSERLGQSELNAALLIDSNQHRTVSSVADFVREPQQLVRILEIAAEDGDSGKAAAEQIDAIRAEAVPAKPRRNFFSTAAGIFELLSICYHASALGIARRASRVMLHCFRRQSLTA